MHCDGLVKSAQWHDLWPCWVPLYCGRRHQWRACCVAAWLWRWGRVSGTWAQKAPCLDPPPPARERRRRPAAPATWIWSRPAPGEPPRRSAPERWAAPAPWSWRCASRPHRCQWRRAKGQKNRNVKRCKWNEVSKQSFNWDHHRT